MSKSTTSRGNLKKYNDIVRFIAQSEAAFRCKNLDSRFGRQRIAANIRQVRREFPFSSQFKEAV